MTDRYEWGVMWTRYEDDPHRWGMNEAQARAWVKEVEAEGMKPGTFVVIRRLVGRWEVVGDDERE